MKMTPFPIHLFVTLVLVATGLHYSASSSDAWKLSLDVFHMDEMCKTGEHTIALDTNRLAAVIRFDSQNMRYPNCSLRVYSAYKPAKRVKFTIHDFNLRMSGCLTLDQYEPEQRVSFVLPLNDHPRVVCYERDLGQHAFKLEYEGQKVGNGSWTSENLGLLIRHVQKYPVDQPHTFTIFVNVVRDPNTTKGDPFCTSNEIKCGNSLCIPSYVGCLGINPCGDQTDCIPEVEEESGPHLLAILGYIAIAIIALVFVCICCRRCCSSSSSDPESDLEDRRNRSGSSDGHEEERVPLENQTSTIPPQDRPPSYIPPEMTYSTNWNTSGLPENMSQQTEPPSYSEVVNNEEKFKIKE